MIKDPQCIMCSSKAFKERQAVPPDDAVPSTPRKEEEGLVFHPLPAWDRPMLPALLEVIGGSTLSQLTFSLLLKGRSPFSQ